MLVLSHIHPRAEAPELALDPDNIEILCHRCKNTSSELAGTA
jgi:5-methylcytosine-specific restriction endonuclease McrA